MLIDHLTTLTERVQLRAYRLLLDTPGVVATVPMIRGVWGRALRHIDKKIFSYVFIGDGPHQYQLPRYLMRPAPIDPAFAPAIDWIIFSGSSDLEQILWRAWDVACGMGLGSDRLPFRVCQVEPIFPTNVSSAGHATPAHQLSQATWPIDSVPQSTACRLSFAAPLRMTEQGKLLHGPNVVDVATSALRRVAKLAGCYRGDEYRDLFRAVRFEASRRDSTPWMGKRCDLVRWSSKQQREIELYGVVGKLDLPAGPGDLWPLLAAACWTHIGKGTVFGLGQPIIERMP